MAKHTNGRKPKAEPNTETLRFNALRSFANRCRRIAERQDIKLQAWLHEAAKEKLSREESQMGRAA